MRSILHKLLLATCIFANACSQDNNDSNSVGSTEASELAWVTRQARPITTTDPVDDDAEMDALGQIIGDSKIAALGESVHAFHEFNQMRLRTLKYLVERKGFRTFITESGIIEGRVVERYVQGDAAVTLKDALTEGFTHGFGNYEETRDLLEWMRAYNAHQQEPGAKIHYYGMDLTSDGDAIVTVLEQLKPYLELVEHSYIVAGSEFSKTFALAKKANDVTDKVREAYLQQGADRIPGNDLDGYTSVSFEQLSADEQAELEEGVKRLNEHIAEKKNDYIAASSEEDYRWGYRSAVSASQMMRDLRSRQKYPRIIGFEKNIEILDLIYKDEAHKPTINLEHLIKDPGDVEEYKQYFLGRETREQALAENVAWAQSLHGNAMVYAHNGHLMKTYVLVRIGDLMIGKTGARSAGEFIEERFGQDYVVVSGTLGGPVDSTGAPIPLSQIPDYVPTDQCDQCMEKIMDKAAQALSTSALLLDLSTATGTTRTWLEGSIDNRWEAGFQKFSPLQAFDGVFFTRSSRPSTPYTP